MIRSSGRTGTTSPGRGSADGLTLPVRDIERIGFEEAWAAVRPQAVHRVPTHPDCPPSWARFKLWVELSRAQPQLLAHLADDDPEMLARITWSRQEYPIARMLLDRAIASSLGGPSVPLPEINFWTDGRTLSLPMDPRPVVPAAAVPWLFTGDWDSRAEPVTGPGRVVTDKSGAQRRSSVWEYFMHWTGGPAHVDLDRVEHLQRDAFHRLDGPAIVEADGQELFYEYGSWIVTD